MFDPLLLLLRLRAQQCVTTKFKGFRCIAKCRIITLFAPCEKVNASINIIDVYKLYNLPLYHLMSLHLFKMTRRDKTLAHS